jgi:hypothetical protein
MPIIVKTIDEKYSELLKATVQVGAFTRTRRGKLERVQQYSRDLTGRAKIEYADPPKSSNINDFEIGQNIAFTMRGKIWTGKVTLKNAPEGNWIRVEGRFGLTTLVQGADVRVINDTEKAELDKQIDERINASNKKRIERAEVRQIEKEAKKAEVHPELDRYFKSEGWNYVVSSLDVWERNKVETTIKEANMPVQFLKRLDKIEVSKEEILTDWNGRRYADSAGLYNPRWRKIRLKARDFHSGQWGKAVLIHELIHHAATVAVRINYAELEKKFYLLKFVGEGHEWTKGFRHYAVKDKDEFFAEMMTLALKGNKTERQKAGKFLGLDGPLNLENSKKFWTPRGNWETPE